MDGLAGRRWWRGWREEGSLSLWVVSVNRVAVYRVLFAVIWLHLDDDRITVA
jgi:hypothetical protein